MSIRNGMLTLLADGPKYGFQLKKEFEALTAGCWPLNVGQVYTTLGRLVRDGLIVEDETDDEGQRSYRLTERGIDELARWFATPRPAGPVERDELTIKIAMAVGTDRPDIEEMLQAQRTEATSALQALTRHKARLGPDDISQDVVLDAAIARLHAEVHWLDLTSARLGARGRARTTTRPNPEATT